MHADETYTPIEGAYKDFYFTPNRTHDYLIETVNRSQNADPYIKLYDSNGNKIAFNDDDGNADSYDTFSRNSKITITLNGGETYKLRTLCYSYTTGYYEFIVRKNSILTESTGTRLNANQTTVVGDTVWYTFTPNSTTFYSFYTVGTVDTCLTLYDESYNQYAFNDDGGVSLNAKIDLYLFASKTYYLKAHVYNMGSATFDIFVNKQRTVHVHPVSKMSEYFTTFTIEPHFFTFTPKTTQSYTIETNFSEADPLINLYNDKMILLSTDDDSGNGNNALLTYTLEAGKTYYIRVRNLRRTTDSGFIYFKY